MAFFSESLQVRRKLQKTPKEEPKEETKTEETTEKANTTPSGRKMEKDEKK